MTTEPAQTRFYHVLVMRLSLVNLNVWSVWSLACFQKMKHFLADQRPLARFRIPAGKEDQPIEASHKKEHNR